MTHQRPVLLSVLVGVAVLAPLLSAYNVSPAPNVVFRKPSAGKSSYFGYAVHLKRNALFVGAPKAESVLARQATISEPGAIFRCSVTDGSCDQYAQLDEKGQDSHMDKSGQYFGASLDGLPERDELVGCAPRYVYVDQKNGEITERAMTGVCYARVNSSTVALEGSYKLRRKQSAFDGASEGFSVHMTKGDGLEVVSGLPFYNFSGAILIYRDAMTRPFVLHSVQEKPGGYFGYSVNSIVVQNKTIYVASAPRSNGSPGKVFIFETKVSNKIQLALHHPVILQGDEIRDYFGYSLCTEDVNGDGLADLLVGAPYYSKNSKDDHGAVFVYINLGFNSNETLEFERQLILTSFYSGSGRFGYSIASLGDINNDGFNDIAVGAPFENQGVVYIYHGSASGITSKPAQVLKNSSNQTQSMFGASIARATDVDGNYYNDVAVGAPTEDRVYLFKTYPILRPIVKMKTSKNFIYLRNSTSGDDSIVDHFDVGICYKYEILGRSDTDHEYDFEVTLSLDSQSSISRAIADAELKLLTFSKSENCIQRNVTVHTTFYNVDNPIVLELTYKLINQTTTGEQFCDSCAILEKSAGTINLVKQTVLFGKECDNDLCEVDMKLRSQLRNFNSTLVINSTKSLEFSYEIINMGDVAYATKLNVNFSQSVKVLKMSGSCSSTDFNMTCTINSGRPLRRNTVVVVNVTIDGTTLTGDRLEIAARLSSSGNELKDTDNELTYVIQLERSSDVEVRGIYNPSYFDIDKQEGVSTIKSKIIVDNLGPSNIQNTWVSVLIPEIFDNGASSCPLVKAIKSLKIINDMQHYNFSETAMFLPATSQNHLKPFNDSNLDFLSNKQENIYSCYTNYTRCRNITFFLPDFGTTSGLLHIELDLEVQPKSLLKLFKNQDNAILSLFLTVDFINARGKINQSTQGSLIFYQSGSPVPVWVYVTSVLFGALILAVITHLLHKRKFFKRMTQSDMEEKLSRENSRSVAFTDGSVMMICNSTANMLA